VIEVGRYDIRTDAEFARSRLAAAGIPCVFAPDKTSDADPIGLSGGARLLVAEADAHEAAAILRHREPTELDRR
jgi:hypothetical protein